MSSSKGLPQNNTVQGGFQPLFGDACVPDFVSLTDADGDTPHEDGFVPLFGSPRETDADPIPSTPPQPDPQPAADEPQNEDSAADAAPPEDPEEPDSSALSDEDVPDGEFLRAQEEGFEVGRRAGLDAGQAEVEQRAESLGAALDEVAALRRKLLEQTVEDIALATVEIARRLVLRELSVGVGDIEGLVRDILDDLRADDDIIVHIAPEDDRLMRESYPSLLAHVGRDASLRMEASSEITRGGVLVETTFGAVEATVERRFEAFADTVQAWARDAVETQNG